MLDQAAFIEVHKLNFHYTLSQKRALFRNKEISASPILRDINFQLPQGAHVTLFGKEATGKTTLLNLLSGKLKPSQGYVRINGKKPELIKDASSGYVSATKISNQKETCSEILLAHAKTQPIPDPASRVSFISDLLKLTSFVHRSPDTLSTTQQIRMNIARAAICDTPLVLFDNITDHFRTKYIKSLLDTVFAGRTVILSTHNSLSADHLALPVLLLHDGTFIHQGTIDEIALDSACPRIVDVWIEGLRYDILRELRKHTGVVEARLIPSDQFAGQRLRVTLRSARYMPAMYDVISQANLVQVEEIPPSLNDIVTRLDSVASPPAG